ncbi:MAG: tRNA (cytidine(56)-2'-O)-methyltransferase [Thermoplasmata archaeon]
MISVLRLGHRIPRDRRITTHVALVARAFGADCILVSTKDSALERSVTKVVEKFGGEFHISTGVNWRKMLKEWKGIIVHLTMYGQKLKDAIPKMGKDDLLIVIGGEKVPSEVYDLADFNISVGNQPHSEVAALAVFLDRLLEGKPLERDFEGNMRIVPSGEGKRVIEHPMELPSREDCLEALLEAGCDADVVEHCKTVSSLAKRIAGLCGADEKLCELGGLLHDIGRGRTHGVDHGVVGAEILREMGFPEVLVKMIERHVGAGITSDEAKDAGLPARSYIPRTLEQKVVAHADNLAEEGKIGVLINHMEERGLPSAAKRMRHLHNELTRLCGIDLDCIQV